MRLSGMGMGMGMGAVKSGMSARPIWPTTIGRMMMAYKLAPITEESVWTREPEGKRLAKQPGLANLIFRRVDLFLEDESPSFPTDGEGSPESNPRRCD